MAPGASRRDETQPERQVWAQVRTMPLGGKSASGSFSCVQQSITRQASRSSPSLKNCHC